MEQQQRKKKLFSWIFRKQETPLTCISCKFDCNPFACGWTSVPHTHVNPVKSESSCCCCFFFLLVCLFEFETLKESITRPLLSVVQMLKIIWTTREIKTAIKQWYWRRMNDLAIGISILSQVLPIFKFYNFLSKIIPFSELLIFTIQPEFIECSNRQQYRCASHLFCHWPQSQPLKCTDTYSNCNCRNCKWTVWNECQRSFMLFSLGSARSNLNGTFRFDFFIRLRKCF